MQVACEALEGVRPRRWGMVWGAQPALALARCKVQGPGAAVH